jgi:hypothetical protein
MLSNLIMSRLSVLANVHTSLVIITTRKRYRESHPAFGFDPDQDESQPTMAMGMLADLDHGKHLE